jgi:hypothetical protein
MDLSRSASDGGQRNGGILRILMGIGFLVSKRYVRGGRVVWDPDADSVMNCRLLYFPIPSVISQKIYVLNKKYRSCLYWPAMNVIVVFCFNHPCRSQLRSTLVWWLLFYAGFDSHSVVWRMYGAGLILPSPPQTNLVTSLCS